MAWNTPFPQRIARATTDALKSHTGDSGELYLDENKGTLTVTDGMTPGGISAAREDRKIISGTSALKINGGTEGTLASDLTLTLEGGVGGSNLAVDVPIDQVDEAILAQLGEGDFITAPIVGSGVSAGQPAPVAKVNMYVGGSGASDIIVDGRGLVPELPFELLSTATDYANKMYTGKLVVFYIQGDIDNGDATINISNGFYTSIRRSDKLSENPTIRCSYLYGNSGYTTLYNLNFVSTTSTNSGIASANGPACFSFQDCHLTGIKRCAVTSNCSCITLYSCDLTVGDAGHSTVIALQGGTAVLTGNTSINGSCSVGTFCVEKQSRLIFGYEKPVFSGNVIGKKYSLTEGSRMSIVGVSADSIPGSVAGVCDTSSQVIV